MDYKDLSKIADSKKQYRSGDIYNENGIQGKVVEVEDKYIKVEYTDEDGDVQTKKIDLTEVKDGCHGRKKVKDSEEKQNVWDKVKDISLKAYYHEDISLKDAEDESNLLLKPYGVSVSFTKDGEIFHYNGKDFGDILIEDDEDYDIAREIFGYGDFDIDVEEPSEEDDWDDFNNSYGIANEDITVVERGWGGSPEDLVAVKGHHPELHYSKLVNKGQKFFIDSEFQEIQVLE